MNKILLFCLLLCFGVPARAATYVVDRADDAEVSACSGADDDCTLRGALTASNANSEENTVVFAPNVRGTIALNGTQLPYIFGNLSIVGPGADVLAIDARSASRFFYMRSYSQLTLSGLTLANGFTPDKPAPNIYDRGGAIYNGTYAGLVTVSDCVFRGNESSEGGAIYSVGYIKLTRCTFSGNRARKVGGAVYIGNGSAEIADSTFGSNSAATGGGAIFSGGSMQLTNSTISGNAVTDGNSPYSVAGGGLLISTDPTFGRANTVASCTITDNHAPAVRGETKGSGVALFGGKISFRNTIIAGNVASDIWRTYSTNNQGLTIDSTGHNLVGTLNNTDDVFTQSGDKVGLDPLLGALQDNGGPTRTHLPLSGSPAIDAGDSALGRDQRGVPRPQGGASDIGATESQINAIRLSLSISPLAPLTNEIVTVVPNGVSPDGSALSYSYVWKRNQTVIADENLASFDLSKPRNGNKRDVISVEVTATDGAGNRAIETISVTVADSAPVAFSGAVSAPADVETEFELGGADADKDFLFYDIVEGPLHGTAEIRYDGIAGKFKLIYRSQPRYGGADSIKFVARDYQDHTSNIATLSINVLYTAPNRAPVLNDVSFTTTQGNALAKQLVGTDADGDTLTYSRISDPANGNLTFNANGSFTYAPNSSFVGVDSFKATVSDGEATSPPATVTITVMQGNRAPVASDAKFETAQGIALSGQLTGTDADGDPFTFTAASNPSNGELILNVDGSFIYSPNASFFGSDSFTFTASDGKIVSVPATVSITITRGNSAPVLNNSSFNTTVSASFSQQLVGTDADGDALTYKITVGTLPDGLNLSASGLIAGTPTQSGSSVVTIEVSDGKGGIGTAQITVVVKVAVVPPTLIPSLTPVSPKTNDTLTVMPNGDAASYAYVWKKNGKVLSGESTATLNLGKAGNGDKNDVITVEVTATNANGGTATAGAQVTVVNSVPIAISSQGVVDHDTEKGFVLNAFDADGDALTYKRVGGPRNGVLADIRVDPTDGVTKLFYKSRVRYGGVDIIRFVVFDSDNQQSNESTLGITVNYTPPPPVNRAPVAGNTFIDTYVNTSVIKGLLGSDPDGDPVTFRIVNNARYGKSEIKQDTDGLFKLFYTSLNRFYGNDRVTYIAVDKYGKESNIATVGINFINRSPVAQGNKIGVASGAEVSQYLFGTDEDGDALTFRLVNNPRYGKGEVKRDGQGLWRFYYQSLPGYVGPDQITFIAIDPMGKESSVAAIDINVIRISGSSALQSGEAPSGGGS